MIRSCTHPARPTTRALAFSVGLAFVIIAATSAPIYAMPQTPQCAARNADTRTKDIVLDGKRGTVDIDVHRDMEATVELPGEITMIVFPKRTSWRFWYRQSKDGRAFAFVPRQMQVGRVTTLTLGSDDPDVAITARVHVVGEAETVEHSLYRVHLQPPKKVCEEMLAAQVAQRVQEQHRLDVAAFEAQRKRDREESEREAREREERARRQARTTVARYVLGRQRGGTEQLPITIIRELSNPRVSLTLMEPQWHNGELMIPYELTNHTGTELESTSIEVTDVYGAPIAVDVLLVEDSQSKPVQLPTLVPDGETLRGVFSVPADDENSIDHPLRIAFMATKARATVAFVPDWHAKAEEIMRRDKLNSQTTVSISPLGGVMWLGDGANQGLLEPTGVGGISARIQKGYYWGGALEAKITGARTGEVRFDDVPWDNMQGDITRRATLVRALGGVAIRFGDKFVFTGRLGLGFQAIVNDSQFLVNGNAADGPGDGIEVDGVWSVGAGFDARLSERWLVGVTASFADAFNTDARSLEGGLQIAYGWN